MSQPRPPLSTIHITPTQTTIANQHLTSPIHASTVQHIQQPADSHAVPLFRMRIIEMDYYTAPPLIGLDPQYSLCTQRPLPTVPINRLFGTTPTGQKVCLHIHNYLPYFYVPLPLEYQYISKQSSQTSTTSQHVIDRYLQSLAQSIELAFNELKLRRQAERDKQHDILGKRQVVSNIERGVGRDSGGAEEDDGDVQQLDNSQSSPNARKQRKPRESLYSLQVVNAKSVFGYNSTYTKFIKLTLTDPAAVKPIAAILQSGCLMNHHVFQPYESHIPYHLQFLADHNLYGMDFLDSLYVTFRRPLPKNAAFQSYAQSKASETALYNGSQQPDEFNGDTPATDSNSTDSSHMGRVWTEGTTPGHMLSSLTHKRTTYCELECDMVSEHILNRAVVHRDALSQTDADTMLVQSLAQIWTMEEQRRVKEYKDAREQQDASDEPLRPPSPLMKSRTTSMSQPRHEPELDAVQQGWRKAFDTIADIDHQRAKESEATVVQIDNSSPVSTPSTKSTRSTAQSQVKDEHQVKAESQAEEDDDGPHNLTMLLTPDTNANRLRASQTQNTSSPDSLAGSQYEIDMPLLLASQQPAAVVHMTQRLQGSQDHMVDAESDVDVVDPVDGNRTHPGSDSEDEDVIDEVEHQETAMLQDDERVRELTNMQTDESRLKMLMTDIEASQRPVTSKTAATSNDSTPTTPTLSPAKPKRQRNDERLLMSAMAAVNYAPGSGSDQQQRARNDSEHSADRASSTSNSPVIASQSSLESHTIPDAAPMDTDASTPPASPNSQQQMELESDSEPQLNSDSNGTSPSDLEPTQVLEAVHPNTEPATTLPASSSFLYNPSNGIASTDMKDILTLSNLQWKFAPIVVQSSSNTTPADGDKSHSTPTLHQLELLTPPPTRVSLQHGWADYALLPVPHPKPHFSIPIHSIQHSHQTSVFASVTANFYPMKIEGPNECSYAWNEYASRFAVGRVKLERAEGVVDDGEDWSEVEPAAATALTVWGHINEPSAYIEPVASNSWRDVNWTTTDVEALPICLQPLFTPPDPYKLYREHQHARQTQRKRDAKSKSKSKKRTSSPTMENYGVQKHVEYIPTASQLFVGSDDDDADSQMGTQRTRRSVKGRRPALKEVAQFNGIDQKGRLEVPIQSVGDSTDSDDSSSDVESAVSESGDETGAEEEEEQLRPASPKYEETFNMEVSYFLPSSQSPANKAKAKKRRKAKYSAAKATKAASKPADDDMAESNPTRQLQFNSQAVMVEEVKSASGSMAPPQKSLKKQQQINIDTPKSTVSFAPTQSSSSSDDSDLLRQQQHEFHMDSNQSQHLTIINLEVLTCTRPGFLPDPLYDPLSAIIYHVKFLVHGGESPFQDVTGVLLVPYMPLHGVPQSQPGAQSKKPASSKKRPAMDIDIPESQSSSHSNIDIHQTHLPLGLHASIRLDNFSSEVALLDGFVRLIKQYDPDIICGYEIQKSSLGYIMERCALYYHRNMSQELSRIIPTVHINVTKMRMDPAAIYAQTHTSGIIIAGRIVLNLWRLFRDELKLNIYTYENVVWNVLKEKHYHVHPSLISQWFKSTLQTWNTNRDLPSLKDALGMAASKANSTPAHKAAANASTDPSHRSAGGSGMFRALMYYLVRCVTSYRLLDTLDVIGRTSELARVFGIKFFNVLDRGSQYRVESMVLRLSKPQSYLLCSLSPAQRATQPAMECMPLIMEPTSRFYTDPVVVFDFQSLYPSMMIAYNLCFTTCLGKIPINNNINIQPNAQTGTTAHALGGWYYDRPNGMLYNMKDDIWVSPNGIMFVKAHRRQGIVPRMLREILETRIMVKNTMKKPSVKTNKMLHRILNARQFGLKLIANVTYGYTAAGYSGRMPCAEIADAIVQTARHTLERAIAQIEQTSRWNAHVLYGDTDSIFVLLEGRSKEDAFKIGQEIVNEVTAVNPKLVQLQMEKIYLPSMLVSKKRYVGYKYEYAQQKDPILDAKGIEMVRRDGTGALVSMMDQMIHILFSSKDLSLVRSYLEREWYKIWQGRVNVQNFIFAKEVRLGTYKQLPLGALIATRAMKKDRRAEPVYAMRVPYIIVDGAPQDKLYDRVLSPHQLLDHPEYYRLSPSYYCERVINPALGRLLDIVGVDIKLWYAMMPRPKKRVVVSLRQIEQQLGLYEGADSNAVDSNKQRNRSANTDDLGWKKHGRGTYGAASNLLDTYYTSPECPSCGRTVSRSINKHHIYCSQCLQNPQLLTFEMMQRLHAYQQQMSDVSSACRRCVQHSHSMIDILPNGNAPSTASSARRHSKTSKSLLSDMEDLKKHSASAFNNIDFASRYGLFDVPCDSLDCEWTYERVDLKEKIQKYHTYIQQLTQQVLDVTRSERHKATASDSDDSDSVL